MRSCKTCPMKDTGRRVVPRVQGDMGEVLFIVDEPSQTDSVIGHLCSAYESNFILEALCERLHINSFAIISVLRCRSAKGLPFTLDAGFACQTYLDAFIEDYEPRVIFFMGDTVYRFLKKEYPKGITISTFEAIEMGGGVPSSVFRMNLRKIRSAL